MGGAASARTVRADDRVGQPEQRAELAEQEEDRQRAPGDRRSGVLGHGEGGRGDPDADPGRRHPGQRGTEQRADPPVSPPESASRIPSAMTTRRIGTPSRATRVWLAR